MVSSLKQLVAHSLLLKTSSSTALAFIDPYIRQTVWLCQREDFLVMQYEVAAAENDTLVPTLVTDFMAGSGGQS